MAQRPSSLSETELDVLKFFWRDGDLSARELHDRIAHTLVWTTSTTRTVLERMRAKGLLSRRDVHGVAVYSHVHPKVQILGGVMQRLSSLLEIDGALPAAAFSGSQLLDDTDIAELQAMLDAADGVEVDE
jgi:BlaI family penicillinase repressor